MGDLRLEVENGDGALICPLLDQPVGCGESVLPTFDLGLQKHFCRPAIMVYFRISKVLENVHGVNYLSCPTEWID